MRHMPPTGSRNGPGRQRRGFGRWPSILRARKRGFSIPAAAWLRGELRPLAQEVLAPARVRAQGYFEPAAVSELLEAHCARREDYSRQLWGLISFSLWAEQVAGAPAAPLQPVTIDGAEHGTTE